MIFLINDLIAKTINSFCEVRHGLILEISAIFLSFEIFAVINTKITHANRGARLSVRSEKSVGVRRGGGAWCVPVMELFFFLGNSIFVTEKGAKICKKFQ
ncbi:MAG: hypothetical protein J6T91_04765 [Alphaproteobacteria bacterium]|nr:hypothetical protein [Alphaproteobacteria bacterium]